MTIPSFHRLMSIIFYCYPWVSCICWKWSSLVWECLGVRAVIGLSCKHSQDLSNSAPQSYHWLLPSAYIFSFIFHIYSSNSLTKIYFSCNCLCIIRDQLRLSWVSNGQQFVIDSNLTERCHCLKCACNMKFLFLYCLYISVVFICFISRFLSVLFKLYLLMVLLGLFWDKRINSIMEKRGRDPSCWKQASLPISYRFIFYSTQNFKP